MRGFRGIYALALGSWLLLLSVVVGFVLAMDMRAAERAFGDEVAYLHRHASDRVHTNESVVEGFAAMVALMGTLDNARARTFAQRIRSRYPHITCFEIVQRGQAGESAAPAPRRDGIRVVAPAGASGGGPAAQAREFRVPVVFSYPPDAGSSTIRRPGGDAGEVLGRALRASARTHTPVASEPFRNERGERVYIVQRPVPHAQRGDATHAKPPERFAMLMIRAESLLPEDMQHGDGQRVVLHHPAVDASEPDGHLYHRTGEVVSRLESWLFPRIVEVRALENASQPFVIRAEHQLGWGDLSWVVLGAVLVAAVLSFAVVLIFARLYHRTQMEQLQTADRLFHMANHDALTGLANRNLLIDRLRHALAQASRQARRVAVLFLDLDGFKQVNDRYGHGSGDSVLRRVAERLRACLREGDTISRVGGDEFVVVLENINHGDTVQGVIDKIRSAFAQPFVVEADRIRVGVSAGVAVYPDDGVEADDLLRRADSAMYADKRGREQNTGESSGE